MTDDDQALDAATSPPPRHDGRRRLALWGTFAALIVAAAAIVVTGDAGDAGPPPLALALGMRASRSIDPDPAHAPQQPVLFATGEIDPVIEVYLRVPTTSTSTRRFFARPARVALSATAWVSPLPSVYTRLLSMPLLTR